MNDCSAGNAVSFRKMPRTIPRVFCVGWHKTGTTTIGLALVKLGYSVLGCRLDMVHPLRRGEIGEVIELAGRFDAVQDVPWAALYKELDEQFPGSRFILTEREPEKWLQSASRHFGSLEIPLHQWLYGDGRLSGNENLYMNRYLRHNESVKRYFADRPDDFLTLNFENGDCWKELCRFLDVSIPASAFPHENKSAAKRSSLERIYFGARDLVPARLRLALFELRIKLRIARGYQDPRNRFHNLRENREERASWAQGERFK